MPRLMVRGIKAGVMSSVSIALVEELAQICECDKKVFNIELLSTTNICNWTDTEPVPFIEVAWFDRGQERRDGFARAIASHFASAGVPHVTVAFINYKRDSYYRDGKAVG